MPTPKSPKSHARTERAYSNQSRRDQRSDFQHDYRGSATPNRDSEGQRISRDSHE